MPLPPGALPPAPWQWSLVEQPHLPRENQARPSSWPTTLASHSGDLVWPPLQILLYAETNLLFTRLQVPGGLLTVFLTDIQVAGAQQMLSKSS